MMVEMIPFEQALQISLDAARLTDQEDVDFMQAVHRVLADDLFADVSMPPFDKSAMDGYACRLEDLDVELEMIEVIQAGKNPSRRIGQGQCAQIMTGAPIPEGADTVIMVEQTHITETGKVVFTGNKTKSNICYLGEDVTAGDLILSKGTLLSGRHIPVLASIGVTSVPVFKRLRVSVVATGTELVEPTKVPGISQIRNTNAPQMQAQLADMGIQADYFGIAPDDEDETRRILSRAAENADLLLLSGGVSMGEFDFVPKVLNQLGFDLKYQRVAVQPGKPTTFGVAGNTCVFALPGNPVSSFVQFEILVKPFIMKCMGHDYVPPSWYLKAGKEFIRKKTDRMAWMPVQISSEGLVMPLDYHGSAHINALNQANGLIYFEIGKARIEEGERIHVRPI